MRCDRRGATVGTLDVRARGLLARGLLLSTSSSQPASEGEPQLGPRRGISCGRRRGRSQRARDSKGGEHYYVPEDSDARKTLIIEYQKGTFEASDRARARAQAGYTIASGISVLVIGGTFFAKIQSQSLFTKIFAVGAVAFWLATVMLYLHAATATVSDKESAEPDETDDNAADDVRYARAAFRVVQVERQMLVGKLNWANYSTAVALLLSAITFGLSLFPVPPQATVVEVQLTDQGQSGLQGLCKLSGGHLDARMDPTGVGQDPIRLVHVKGCSGFTNVAIPRSWVQFIASGGHR